MVIICCSYFLLRVRLLSLDIVFVYVVLFVVCSFLCCLLCVGSFVVVSWFYDMLACSCACVFVFVVSLC